MTELFETQQMRQTQDLFIANLAHDLKNPLQAQIISLELLLNGLFGKLNPKQSEMIGYTIESAKFLQKMLHSLLESYKYNNSKIILNKNKISITELLHYCLNETAALAQAKNIKIKQTFSNINNNFKINADEIHLRRVFENIINNALNYAPNNSDLDIKIKISKSNILIIFTNQTTTPSNLKIQTKNPFQYNNFGLGLNICRQIIEAHNGTINISQNNNKYLFSIELPL